MFERGVAVIGLGYIGLPTGATLASHGINVLGVDVDPDVVDQINAGKAPFAEPDLSAAVERAVQKGLLSARLDVPEADVYLIAVPTPFKGDHQPDLAYVEAATRAVASHLERGALIILESTSPPGTTEQMSAWLAEERPDLSFPHQDAENPDVHLAHCPERVLPGQIMRELVENDRIVGGLTPACAERAAALYRVICRGRVTLTDARSAEMAKLVENSFRDVNIAFANELAEVCSHLDLDVWEIIRLANKHPRVNILNPGPGVGGHCIAVDPWFIVAAAPEQATIIRAARTTNDSRPRSVAGEVSAVAAEGASVACLGLTFKADVDDIRESPAVEVVRLLAEDRPDLRLTVVDPHVAALPASLADAGVALSADTTGVVGSSDVVVLLVDHQVFRALDPKLLASRPVIDTRGVWNPATYRTD